MKLIKIIDINLKPYLINADDISYFRMGGRRVLPATEEGGECSEIAVTRLQTKSGPFIEIDLEMLELIKQVERQQ